MSDVIAASLRVRRVKIPFLLLKCKRAKIWFRSFFLECRRDEKKRYRAQIRTEPKSYVLPSVVLTGS